MLNRRINIVNNSDEIKDYNYILMLYSIFVSLINFLDNPKLIENYLQEDRYKFAKEVLDWCEDPDVMILDIFDDLAFPHEPRRSIRPFIKMKALNLLSSLYENQSRHKTKF